MANVGTRIQTSERRVSCPFDYRQRIDFLYENRGFNAVNGQSLPLVDGMVANRRRPGAWCTDVADRSMWLRLRA